MWLYICAQTWKIMQHYLLKWHVCRGQQSLTTDKQLKVCSNSCLGMCLHVCTWQLQHRHKQRECLFKNQILKHFHLKFILTFTTLGLQMQPVYKKKQQRLVRVTWALLLTYACDKIAPQQQSHATLSSKVQHSMGGVVHIPKGPNMQCDTLSPLPDYCVDLNRSVIM